MTSLAPPHSRARASVGRALLATATMLAIVPHASRADADEKQACVTASEKAQQLRSAGKLGEARDQLNICGRPECPKLVQQDCTQWMSEVLSSLPSVVPGAKDRKGRDIVEARLTVDGKVVAEMLDGKPIVIDPGVHTFVFDSKGLPAVKEQVVVKPGEKNRIVSVTFATPDDATTTTGAGAGAPRETSSGSAPPVAAYVLGGVGLAALGAALYFDLTAGGDAHDLRTGCAPNCAQSDVDDVKTKYTIAGVTAGIGGALLVTGIVLFLVHGKGSSRTGANPLRLSQPATSLASGALLRF
jgi:hypothetical protein